MAYEKLKNKWNKFRADEAELAKLRKDLLLIKGVPVLKEYGVTRAILFGSLSTGRCKQNSDIDLFVNPLSAENFWKLSRDLEDALNLSVDLYSDSDDSTFVQKIITRGVVIYDISKDGSEMH